MTNDSVLQKQESASREVERAHSLPTVTPAVDIYDRKDALVLLADIPGAEAGSVDVRYEHDVLTITARVKGESFEGYEAVMSEYRAGEYYRAFTLTEDIDAEKIEASVKNGVLRLVLPKSEKAKPKKITVTAG